MSGEDSASPSFLALSLLALLSRAGVDRIVPGRPQRRRGLGSSVGRGAAHPSRKAARPPPTTQGRVAQKGARLARGLSQKRHENCANSAAARSWSLRSGVPENNVPGISGYGCWVSISANRATTSAGFAPSPGLVLRYTLTTVPAASMTAVPPSGSTLSVGRLSRPR